MSDAIQQVTPNLALPDFMREDAQKQVGLEVAKTLVKPMRLKIVQPLSKAMHEKGFGDGDMVLMPLGAPVAAMPRLPNGQPDYAKAATFNFTPIFLYKEYCKQNDVNRAELPFIADRSFDPQSDIAMRALNPKRRQEPYPDGSAGKLTYAEHINVIARLVNCPATSQPVLLTFFKGEHFVGSNLCTILVHRSAPPYGNILSLKVGPHKNKVGQTWPGFDIDVPKDGPTFIQNADEYAKLRDEHLNFKKLHDERRLITEYEPDIDGDGDGVSNAAAKEW